MHNGRPRKGGEKGTEKVSEHTMAKNFPNLIKNITLHIQDAQQTLSRKNSKNPLLQ